MISIAWRQYRPRAVLMERWLGGPRPPFESLYPETRPNAMSDGCINNNNNDNNNNTAIYKAP